jgi:hypothetical protein
MSAMLRWTRGPLAKALETHADPRQRRLQVVRQRGHQQPARLELCIELARHAIEDACGIAHFDRAGALVEGRQRAVPGKGSAEHVARLYQASHRCRQPACAERRCGADDQETDRVVDHEEVGGKRRRFAVRARLPLWRRASTLSHRQSLGLAGQPRRRRQRWKGRQRARSIRGRVRVRQDAAGHEAERGDVAHDQGHPHQQEEAEEQRVAQQVPHGSIAASNM